jgi:hypothetical protein
MGQVSTTSVPSIWVSIPNYSNFTIFNSFLGYFTGSETEKYVFVAGEKRSQVGTKIFLTIHKFGQEMEIVKTIETNIYFQIWVGYHH